MLAAVDEDTQETPYAARIHQVHEGSPAERAGVKEGWELVTVNGLVIPDILAYRRELAKGVATIVARDPVDSLEVAFTVGWEDPGLEFADVIFDGLRLCANKCEFCYVHQMPQGFRKSLYVMDDDFRTSFLYGSFITLTNLSEADMSRILNENLSPLYVSVHTTNEELRRDMMRWWRFKVKDARSTSIRHMLERLSPIELYTQVVLLPGRNDGQHLSETLEFLAGRRNVSAVAVVPVGLTEHRKNLPELRPFTSVEARQVLSRVTRFQARMLAERGTRFAFLSDEFYLLAGEEIPADEAYEGYPMLENGVGMIRDFLSGELPVLPPKITPSRKVVLATGMLFAPLLKRAVAPLAGVAGLELEVRPLVNRTFGPVTTVTGLLGGRDFLSQVTPGEADLLLLSPNVLKFGSEVLLDDITLADLRRELRMAVEVGGTNLGELISAILRGQSEGRGPQFGFSTHALKEAAKQH